MILKRDHLTIPNGLSVSRIIFMPILLLFLFYDQHLLFLIFYIIIGSTDLFDGLIAKNYNITSEMGKTLDSVSDLVFYLGTLYFIYYLFPHIVVNNSTMLLIFFIVFSLSFIVSWIKLGKPVLMHTQLLRLNAVLVYFLLIFSFVWDTTYFASLILVIYYLAFTEEMVIFLKYKEFDRDARSIFHIMREKRDKKVQ